MDPRLDLSSHKIVVRSSPKLIDFSQLGLVHHWHKNKKIAHCHGVFDVLHLGHIDYFYSAKNFGDILVVTLTEDKFVNKGAGRPYFNHNVRARMVAALEMVDYVAINQHAMAVPVIETLKPHFYVKGPDYKGKTIDPTRGIYKEKMAVEAHGGQLVFTEDPTLSSSEIINQVLREFTEDQRTLIRNFKDLGGTKYLEAIFNQLLQNQGRLSGPKDKIENVRQRLAGLMSLQISETQSDDLLFSTSTQELPQKLSVLESDESKDPFQSERIKPRTSLALEKKILALTLLANGCDPLLTPYLENLFEDLAQVNDRVNSRRMLKALESNFK